MPGPRTRRWRILAMPMLVGSLFFSGCGLIAQPLPDATRNLDLATLEEIQDDERLTDDERRERIRELAEAPNTDAGDRLVEFLLTFNVP